MGDWQPLSVVLDPTGSAPVSYMASGPPSPVATGPRHFADFWRRIGAFTVDSIILWIGCTILGTIGFDFFTSLGPFGLLVGLAIALVYFGVQNSELCQGRTLGKRLLGIEVVDEEGNYIPPVQAGVRYLVFSLPFFLCNGAIMGPTLGSSLGLMFMAVATAWIGTIWYLAIFNWPTRRNLHDMLLHTYVVRSTAKGPVESPLFWKPHWAIIGALAVTGCGTMMAAGLLLMHFGPFPKLLAMDDALAASPQIQYASINSGERWDFENGKSRTTRSLEINAVWNGKPANRAEAARQVAEIVLRTGESEVADKDSIVIEISYGYNIGFASGNVSRTYEHSTAEWQDIVQNHSSP